MERLFNPCSRRDIARLIAWLLAARVTAVCQTEEFGAAIRKSGVVATFSTKGPRPMETLATAFSNTYSISVTFEEAEVLFGGDVVDVTVNPIGGRRAFRLRDQQLTFTYPVNADSGLPIDTKSAVEAAIVIHNTSGFHGSYELRVHEPYFHIVPIGRRDSTGTMTPTTSPLDERVSLEARGRHPQLVLFELLDVLQKQRGVRILRGPTPFLRGQHENVQVDFDNLPARAVLRSLVDGLSRDTQGAKHPHGRRWYLLYDASVKAYGFSIV